MAAAKHWYICRLSEKWINEQVRWQYDAFLHTTHDSLVDFARWFRNKNDLSKRSLIVKGSEIKPRQLFALFTFIDKLWLVGNNIQNTQLNAAPLLLGTHYTVGSNTLKRLHKLNIHLQKSLISGRCTGSGGLGCRWKCQQHVFNMFFPQFWLVLSFFEEAMDIANNSLVWSILNVNE